MDQELFKTMLEEYLSQCSLDVEHDNGEGYYRTAKIEVRLNSPDGKTLFEGTAYTSTFEKAKSDW